MRHFHGVILCVPKRVEYYDSVPLGAKQSTLKIGPRY